MRNLKIYKVTLGSMLLLIMGSMAAQSPPPNPDLENRVRTEQHAELSKLGFGDLEIFEDLGNAHFLMERYDTAVFWYEKLIKLSQETQQGVSDSHLERYQVALSKIGALPAMAVSPEKDWFAAVKSDYTIKTSDVRANAHEELAETLLPPTAAPDNSKIWRNSCGKSRVLWSRNLKTGPQWLPLFWPPTE